MLAYRHKERWLITEHTIHTIIQSALCYSVSGVLSGGRDGYYVCPVGSRGGEMRRVCGVFVESAGSTP